MQTDYPELRAWLADQENFESVFNKSPWIANIKDNQQMSAVAMLDFNNKVQPSAIIVIMPDGSFRDFWYDVYIDQQLDVPYDIRLPRYSAYFVVY